MSILSVVKVEGSDEDWEKSQSSSKFFKTRVEFTKMWNYEYSENWYDDFTDIIESVNQEYSTIKSEEE